MIPPKALLEQLRSDRVSFFTGVPDSLLKHFCSCVTDCAHAANEHVIAANEGGAIALATGHYLATREYALVYMQNSGLGNAVNPLLSLADPEVYSIPMLLMIGWRGEPGHHDEPQHVKQGRVTLDLLRAMEIPYAILEAATADWQQLVALACSQMRDRQGPVAIVVKAGTFEPYERAGKDDTEDLLTREQAIDIIVGELGEQDIIVSTTGKTSRELFELRRTHGQKHNADFLTVGSMGHSSQIALGIALQKPNRQVFCLDGDGSVLMHTGGLAIVGQMAPTNFRHIVLNNEAHDSVGGQPTASSNVDYVGLARATGYRCVARAIDRNEVENAVRQMVQEEGPCFLEVRVRKGARKDLGRPTSTPLANRNDLMEGLLG